MDDNVELTCFYCLRKFEGRKRNEGKRRFCSKTCLYKQHQIDRSDEYTMFRTQYNKTKHDCERFGREFCITLEDVKLQWEKQVGICNLTGIQLYFGKSKDERDHGFTTASIDRIDNDRDYFPDNIQWIHKKVNTDLKRNLLEDELIYWARKISWHNRDRYIYVDYSIPAESIGRAKPIDYTIVDETPF